MQWRRTAEVDLPGALAIDPRVDGSGLVGYERALTVWRQLIAHPACLSAVVELASPRGVVAFGAACYVSPRFVEREVEHPQPGLNDRFVASCLSDEPALLTWREVAAGNAGPGLEQLQLCSVVANGIGQAEEAQAGMILAASLVSLVRGDRLWGALGLLRTDLQRRHALNSGCRVVDLDDGSSMFRVDRRALDTHPGGIGTVLFQYTEPRLRFTRGEQELLLSTLNGATDAELCGRLQLSMPAVKARWRSILARAEVLLELGSGTQGPGRGPQKRHKLLAYCREHPEELRPYAWSTPCRP